LGDVTNESVVVIGLGRFGTALAEDLTRLGAEVLATDNSPKRVQALAGRLTHVVTADATDIEALRQLGVTEFYRAIVAIGSDLEASILVTSLLVELGIEDIWARAVSAQHGRILDRIGAHHIVFPEYDMGERVAHQVFGKMLDYIELDENFAVAKTKPTRDIVGVPLGETNLRAKQGVTIVLAKAPGESFTYATADTILTYDDIILVAGRIENVERFARSG
jgi:trk system potassium uptake protein TrkA